MRNEQRWRRDVRSERRDWEKKKRLEVREIERVKGLRSPGHEMGEYLKRLGTQRVNMWNLR